MRTGYGGDGGGEGGGLGAGKVAEAGEEGRVGEGVLNLSSEEGERAPSNGRAASDSPEPLYRQP